MQAGLRRTEHAQGDVRALSRALGLAAPRSSLWSDPRGSHRRRGALVLRVLAARLRRRRLRSPRRHESRRRAAAHPRARASACAAALASLEALVLFGVPRVWRARLAPSDVGRALAPPRGVHDDPRGSARRGGMTDLDRSAPPTVVDQDGPHQDATAREWPVTNGGGGYASGTITGAITRRFHGLLIAALDSPLGRTMMLNHLAERVKREDGSVRLDEQKTPGESAPLAALKDFRLDRGLPVWRYDLGS